MNTHPQTETESRSPSSAGLPPFGFSRFITVGSVVGLVSGFGLGGLAHAFPNPVLEGLGAIAGPLGEAWTKSLLLVAVPLIVVFLILAASGDGVARTARLGAVSLLTFLAILVGAASFTLVTVPWLLRWVPTDSAGLNAALQALGETGIRAMAGAAATPDSTALPGFGERFVAMIPENVGKAFSDGDIMGLVVVSVVFGLALSRIGSQGQAVLSLVRGIRSAILVVTYWVILAMPLGAFCLAYTVGATTGGALAGTLGAFLLIHIGLLLAATLLLYPVAAVAGGGRVGIFARAVWPAQGVAMSTRSSLASLPALMEGARTRLHLPEDVVGLTIPLGASTFKMNTLVTTVFKLLFLAHLYRITLDPAYILLFIGVQILTSPSVPGIPSGGFVTTYPMYMAVGIPLEAVVLLKAIDALPDIFKTLANVTGYMTAGVIVARTQGWRMGEETPISHHEGPDGEPPRRPQVP